MARLLVLQTFHMFYASLIAQMSWQPSSARQCADEACPEEKYLGQAVLQTTHVKEQLFDEDGISDDTADGDDAIKSNMELIHGIRVYGYHSALHADSEDDVELLATEFDPVIWIFVFTDKATDADMLNFCNDLAAKARCTMTGHPDEKGLPMDVLRATKAELQQILAKHPEVSFVEADSKVYAMPHVLQDPAALLDAESSTLPWGLDRIDERTIDSTSSYTPSPKSGSGVHVYVLDRGVRTTHSQLKVVQFQHWNRTRMYEAFSPPQTPHALQIMMDMGLTVPVLWPVRTMVWRPRPRSMRWQYCLLQELANLQVLLMLSIGFW